MRSAMSAPSISPPPAVASTPLIFGDLCNDGAKDCTVTAQRRCDIIAAVIDGLAGAERLSRRLACRIERTGFDADLQISFRPSQTSRYSSCARSV
jgi:hypothetical protein